jgi:hypothetical protein
MGLGKHTLIQWRPLYEHLPTSVAERESTSETRSLIPIIGTETENNDTESWVLLSELAQWGSRQKHSEKNWWFTFLEEGPELTPTIRMACRITTRFRTGVPRGYILMIFILWENGSRVWESSPFFGEIIWVQKANSIPEKNVETIVDALLPAPWVRSLLMEKTVIALTLNLFLICAENIKERNCTVFLARAKPFVSFHEGISSYIVFFLIQRFRSRDRLHISFHCAWPFLNAIGLWRFALRTFHFTFDQTIRSIARMIRKKAGNDSKAWENL